MYSKSFSFSDASELNVLKIGMEDGEKLLITVFFSNKSVSEIKKFLNTLSGIFPLAQIIGASTSGEIYDGKILDGTISVNFTKFTNTKLQTSVFYGNTNFSEGLDELISADSKLVIVLSDGFNTASELSLENFSKKHPEIIIAGGKAGQKLSEKDNQTYVICGNEVLNEGTIALSLSSSNLNVFADYDFNWHCVGKGLEVTGINGNELFELDGIPIREIYEKYLGKKIGSSLDDGIMEFPLIVKRNGYDVARDVIGFTDNGFVLTGPLLKGEKVRFGCGNKEQILNSAMMTYSNRAQSAGMNFVFSCAGRRKFLGEDAQREISLLGADTPSIGFFTYSEFLGQNGKFGMLNLTTVLINVSEGILTETLNKVIDSSVSDTKNIDIGNDGLVTSLSKLLISTSDELTKINSDLNDRVAFEIQKHEKIHNEYYEAHRNILKFMPDGALITDSSGKIIFNNGSFEKIFGYSEEDLKEKPIMEIMETSTREKFFQNVSGFYKFENKDFFGKFVKKDGEVIPVEVSIMPFVNNDYVIVVKDFKEIKDLISKNEELKKINRMKDDFINTAGHELRTPLTAINGYVSMMKDGSYGPLGELEYPVTTIHKCAKQLLNIINGMLDLSKLENGKMTVKKESGNLIEFVEETITEFLALANKNGIVLSYSYLGFPNGRPDSLELISDFGKLKIVINNLLSNALKFTQSGGHVTLILTKLEGFIEVSIIDDGIGIKKEDFGKVFSKFGQVDSPLNRSNSGSGLGLPLAKEMVDALGFGSLKLESEFGKGTKFSFSIPFDL